MKPIRKEKVKKILIIKLRGIGDVVLSTIVIDNLRKDFPKAQIDYLVESPSQPGLSGLKEIKQVLIFDRNNFWNKVSMVLQIRKNKYDLILDLFSNPSTALVTFFSGAKYRVGFPYRGRRYAYNLYGPAERGKYHSALLHLETLKMIGLNSSYKQLYYYISPAALRVAEKYLRDSFIENNFVVGICPTGGWESKKCDPSKFAEIAKAVIKKYNAKIFILWGKSDQEDAFKIQSLIGDKSIIAPETTIQELAALIARCKILIANDSGPMHIATSVGTPVLGLFGPTSPHMQGPFGEMHEWVRLDELDCIECNLLVCPKQHECFRDLPLEKVLDKVDYLISKNNILIKS
ncbi:MAG: glycosyltransferase family 9 protein [Ignavibacteriales bacterium]|nr:glycosyltransferase family 9 protein [Ignavibacteriales bacterium]